MPYIEDFMNYKIGIDVLHSDFKDIKELSKCIEHAYIDYINDYENEKTLEEYYLVIYDDEMDTPWQILVYEPSNKNFNAYRGESYDDYMKNHKMMTAAEILNYPTNQIDINEKDIEGILCLK